jgi:hypothetical protein
VLILICGAVLSAADATAPHPGPPPVSISATIPSMSATTAVVATPAHPILVRLLAPLSSLVAAAVVPTGAKTLSADIEVPADAPADLGVGAWLADRDGHWYQVTADDALAPGHHTVTFDLRDGLISEPAHAGLMPDQAERSDRAGLFFWSIQPSAATLAVTRLEVHADATAASTATAAAPTMVDREVRLDEFRADLATFAAGTRWTVDTLPRPFPENPYDPDEFRLDLIVTGPQLGLKQGASGERRIPGFYLQPMIRHDRGDGEMLIPVGDGHFEARFRPDLPGTYHLKMEAVWDAASGHARTVTTDLDDLTVTGPAHDDRVMIAGDDARFFTVGGKFWWPIGINLHSPFDHRGHDVTGTILTPDRGSLVYDALLARFAAAGGDAAEIWMAAWNTGLEWRADWPGYQGRGRYNQGNAWKLDTILDAAWSHGIRINLVINNHGQASAASDREWPDNPWNAALGGPLATPAEVFWRPEALAGQENLRRYIIGRYADHPAILGWKLWSEVDLTGGRGLLAVDWHRQAAERWHALDTYHHPVTTHWAGDFRRVDPAIATLPGIDFLCIDAYRQPTRLLADLLADSTTYPGRGLSAYGKPVLTSEFGATAGAAPAACRMSDHATGAFAALVSGHAGAPMLWWFEWVDQGGLWQPYRAIRHFIQGEDLRGGRSALLDCVPDGRLWARAWVRPGRLLGYLIDRPWGEDGTGDAVISGAQVEIGTHVAPGHFTLEWWDADRGEMLSRTQLDHAGGTFTIAVPDFTHHIAFKLMRSAAAAPAGAMLDVDPGALDAVAEGGR